MVDQQMISALEATWPPERVVETADCRIRLAPGAGSRVNSIQPKRLDLDDAAVAAAEAEAAAAGAAPLWAVPEPAESVGAATDTLAETLLARGYERFDASLIMAGEPGAILAAAEDRWRARKGEAEIGTLALRCPLTVIEQIWARGGIGPERLAVMERPTGPKEVFMARNDNRPVGAGFVAVDPATGVAFVHALEVTEESRGRGVGPAVMRAAARFAVNAGAKQLAVAVRRSNEAGLRLFQAIGLQPVGGYVYYRKKA